MIATTMFQEYKEKPNYIILFPSMFQGVIFNDQYSVIVLTKSK